MHVQVQKRRTVKLSCWLLSSSSGFMSPTDARSMPNSDSGTGGIDVGTGKGSGGGYGIAMTLRTYVATVVRSVRIWHAPMKEGRDRGASPESGHPAWRMHMIRTCFDTLVVGQLCERS